MRAIIDPYEAWHFLYNHPMFNDKDAEEAVLKGFAEAHTSAKEEIGKKDYRNLMKKFPVREEFGIFSQFANSYTIDFVKVDPMTGEINTESPQRNTATRVWLECGPWKSGKEMDEGMPEDMKGLFPRGHSSHDPDLDCGAPTFEQAIVKLANLVLLKYRNYKNSPFVERPEPPKPKRKISEK